MLDKKYNHLTVEEGRYKYWLDNKLFESGDVSKEPFCIVIPPPNITGNLHLGHAWDTTLQDITIRYKKMDGFDTLWLPGMDHAAIATESKVVNKLKKEGINKYELGREEFLKECWKWKESHANTIRKQWAKLGLALDYNKERFTLDEGLNKAVNYVFVTLYNKGLIYRGEKIINWDIEAMTALSNEEVIYKEEKTKLYYLKYYFEDGNDFLEVATTRPETIFGDVAVAVNPKDPKYINHIGKKVYVPYIKRLIPIIADEAVLIDFGTGALKITPAHSMDDFEIGKRHNLEIINCLNSNGTLNENTKAFNGMTITEARDKMIKCLQEENLINKIEDYVHSVGHSERTDVVVEPYISKQWFVKMDSLAKNLLDHQKSEVKIKFIPKRFEKVLIHWMENVHDWCISRQLWWGHRIPAWYKGEEIYVGITPPKGEGWIQDEDVLDTWFSSALWPFSTLGWPEETDDFKRYFPTNVIVPGYDIIFFWVARMAFTSVEFTGKSPFEYCLIHGLIRDEQGRKMSKSLNNGVDPMQMIELYGADALRFYLTTSSAPGMDLRFDEEKLKSSWNFINKIWNASRYVLLNLENFKESNFSLKNLSLEDEWILTKLNKTIKEVRKNMDKFSFNNVGNELYEFTWNIYCDWYIELTKRSLDNNTTKSVLLLVLTSLLKLLHPFIPFVTEEIYQMLPYKEKSIMISEYPKYNKEHIFKESEGLMDKVINQITLIRNFKVVNNIPKENEIIIEADTKILPILKSMLKIDNKYDINKKEAYKITYNSDLINVDIYFNKKEDLNLLSELNKEKEVLKSSINKRKALLNNENYITKAPKEIIEAEREKLISEKKRLQIIMSKLNEIN